MGIPSPGLYKGKIEMLEEGTSRGSGKKYWKHHILLETQHRVLYIHADVRANVGQEVCAQVEHGEVLRTTYPKVTAIYLKDAR